MNLTNLKLCCSLKVGFASIVSHELGRIRDFWDQPSSRTWTLMLLTGGGIAVYLLCRKKCQEDNDALIFSGLDPSTRRRPSSHGRRSRWGAQTWFGWLWDPVGEADNAPSAVFESQVRNLQVFSIIKIEGQETNLQFQISFT